jgi:glycosyltransferase involved in cell wall biosynthesis
VLADAARNRRAAGEVGVVVIGRNEGVRLERCITSLLSLAARVVYVDSNSTDGSPAWARAQGVDVVQLDMGTPFTAARARNAGYRRLREMAPNLAFVQFVDGDCELAPSWLMVACDFLRSRPGIGAVCGRLRERYPRRSVYNRLCDQEWDAPAGRARSCGGIAMMRTEAFDATGGFRDELIAGEEPELCVRLRQAGWEVWRLADEMALHDAAMLHFSQWWKRARRGGHAFAEGVELHGAPPERHYVVETRRALLWGLIIPVVILALGLVHAAWLLLVLIYPLQVLRLAWRDGMASAATRWRALFLVIARFPEAQGVLLYWFNRLRRRRSALIEYK